MGRDHDWLRRFPFRYLGLTFEMAKAATPYVPPTVLPMAMKIRNVYIGVDAAHKSLMGLRGERGGIPMALVASGDVLIFHGLASVAIPGLILTGLKHKLSTIKAVKPIAPALTLLAVPFLIAPVDFAANAIVRIFYRSIMGKSYTSTCYAPFVTCAIRPLLPCSMLGYLAIGGHLRTFYIGADAYQKAWLATGENKKFGISNKIVMFGDVLLWHAMANGFLPGAIMHEAKALLQRYLRLPYIPSLLTLALIPVIIQPVDCATQLFMNMTYRNLMGPSSP